MKQPGFWEGVIVALIASISGAMTYFGLSMFINAENALSMVISLLASAYILYLLSRSRERTGRVTVMVFLVMSLTAIWLFDAPLSVLINLVLLGIWLIRSLYFHGSLFAALADLGLCGFSLAAAFWTLHHTGSLFLSFWCFFLSQALFVLITIRPNQHSNNSILLGNKTVFNRAYQTAQAAICKLSSIN